MTRRNCSWTLDFWGKQAALIAQARDTASEAAALDAEAARLALSGAFAQTYIDLLLAYAEWRHRRRTRWPSAQDILNLTQGRFNAGLENEAAVEQAKALLAMAQGGPAALRRRSARWMFMPSRR